MAVEWRSSSSWTGSPREHRADHDQRGGPVELSRLLLSRRQLQPREGLVAQDTEAPRVGGVVVGGPAGELEQLAEHLPVERLGAEDLVGAAGADGVFGVHRGAPLHSSVHAR